MQTAWRRIALVFLILVLASCGMQKDTPPANESGGRIRNPALAPRLGRQVPEIDGEDLGGTRFKLSDYRGKVVLLDFWGFWCPHCVRLIPHEKALIERMKERPFVVLGVNSDPNRAEAEKYSFELALNWRSWWDGSTDGPIARIWQPEAFPMLYVIDHKGILRYKNFLIDEQMEEWIQRLVNEAEASARKS